MKKKLGGIEIATPSFDLGTSGYQTRTYEPCTLPLRQVAAKAYRSTDIYSLQRRTMLTSFSFGLPAFRHSFVQAMRLWCLKYCVVRPVTVRSRRSVEGSAPRHWHEQTQSRNQHMHMERRVNLHQLRARWPWTDGGPACPAPSNTREPSNGPSTERTEPHEHAPYELVAGCTWIWRLDNLE